MIVVRTLGVTLTYYELVKIGQTMFDDQIGSLVAIVFGVQGC